MTNRTSAIPAIQAVVVIVESLNNPLRFLFGWFAVTLHFAPPVSVLLAYWCGGAFLMAAKRVLQALLARLAGIAVEHGLAPTLCSQPELLVPGLGEARCIDAERLSDVAQRPVAARENGNRRGCGCAQSRDIGAYDSCPHGCVYCYAVADRDRAVANFRAHDPEADCLAPPERRPAEAAHTVTATDTASH